MSENLTHRELSGNVEAGHFLTQNRDLEWLEKTVVAIYKILYPIQTPIIKFV
jgi:hypothetical protein